MEIPTVGENYEVLSKQSRLNLLNSIGCRHGLSTGISLHKVVYILQLMLEGQSNEEKDGLLYDYGLAASRCDQFLVTGSPLFAHGGYGVVRWFSCFPVIIGTKAPINRATYAD